MKYVIVEANDAEALQVVVSQKLNAGYQVCGGLCVYKNKFFQALTVADLYFRSEQAAQQRQESHTGDS